ncbi:MAG: cytochrome c1 [Lysobacteraceae bacterium]
MLKRLTSTLILFLAVVGTASAAGYATMENSQVNLRDQASLQRGAALFMNYCAGCHSLKFQRYSRMAEDLGLTEEQVMTYLNFTDAAFGETMQVAMDYDDGTAWFGKGPPDLSLVARGKAAGPDWTYTFLKSFYTDESRPMGWNNTVLESTSMPNVLWELQGIQAPVYGEDGEIERFELVQAGSMNPAEFEQAIRDISAFLAYVGEPAALKRQSMGVWVLLFLSLFTFMAWLLKTEYWRDVH